MKKRGAAMKDTVIGISTGVLMGYLIGTLSPAALIGKLKKRNLRKSGTGNLGASNVMLHFGKWLGVLVMAFDILKAFCAARLARYVFPHVPYIMMIAGIAAILGHIYPFYMHFKGGKGLAAFGGLIMAYEPWLLAFVLAVGSILMLILSAVLAASTVTTFLYDQLILDVRIFSAEADTVLSSGSWSPILMRRMAPLKCI